MEAFLRFLVVLVIKLFSNSTAFVWFNVIEHISYNRKVYKRLEKYFVHLQNNIAVEKI